MKEIGFRIPGTEPKESAPFKPSSEEKNVLNFFRQSYRPAYNFKEANCFLSTDEILSELRKHCGTLTFDKAYLNQWLKDNGYHTDTIEAMQMVWLLIEEA